MSRLGRANLLVGAGVVLVTLYAFPYVEKIRNANELPRIYLVQSIVEQRTFAIDEGVRRYGWVVDTASYGGHLYSNKAPGLSFVGVPVYAVLRMAHRAARLEPPSLREQTYVLRLFCVTLPALAFLLVFWRLTALFCEEAAARRLALVGYALGTLALPLALVFMSHQPATVLLGTSFWLLSGRARLRALAGAGACAAGAVVMDYQAAFFALPIAIYAVWRIRPVWRLGVVLAGTAPPAVLLALYHRACFGGVLRTGYAYATVPAFRAIHHQGLLGLTRPSWKSFYDGFLAPGSGLLPLAPWLVLGLLYLGRALVRGPRTPNVLVASGMVATGIAFLSSLLFARGGWGLGPRYIAILVPFVAAPAAKALALAQTKRAWAALAGGLVLCSVAIHVGGGLVFPQWPDKLRNPVVELAWPLVRDGYVPYNAGWVIGLPGGWSMVPVFAVAAAVVVGCAARSAAARAGTVAIGLALLGCFWLAPRTPGPDAVGIARWIESIWEPAQAGSATALPPAPMPAASPASPAAKAPVPPR